MTKFEQKFTIHPIGQGLFYSGEINVNNQVKFRMVFDCGSLPPSTGKDEVKYYRDTHFDTDKILDLLVISHFDADHINKIKVLLGADIKVKKLVMPFLNFEERLFLVARYLDSPEGSTIDDATDQIIDFILDPLAALAENFDGDTEYYFIVNDPNNPILPDEETLNDESPSGDNDGRFIFGFDNQAREILTHDDKKQLNLGKSTIGTGYKVLDSNKGKLSVPGRGMVLMDFLFYKINIGSSQNEFYKKVKEIFYAKCGVIADDDADEIMRKMLEKIKPMKGSTTVKGIFKEAINTLGITSFDITYTELYDLNTTALCMMHRNSINIFKLIGLRNKEEYHFFPHHYGGNITSINIIGNAHKRLEFRNHYPWYHIDHYVYHDGKINRFIYPNVLLTSDSLLKTETQLDGFFIKYKYYWDCFWLFQIPHHGSEKNADTKLLSKLADWQYNFINYGTVNNHDHPSGALIDDLISTGHSKKTLSNNEFQGLSFELFLEH